MIIGCFANPINYTIIEHFAFYNGQILKGFAILFISSLAYNKKTEKKEK